MKGTINFGLKYKSDEESDLIGYYDSDYAGDLDDRKSTSSFFFFLELIQLFGIVLNRK